MSVQIQLFEDDPGRPLPNVYTATRLTCLDTDGQSLVESWCFVIRETIERLAEDGWQPRLHLPIKHSAPWKGDGRTSAAVYELNSGLLWTDVDALIVLTYGGGSLGAGSELTTALQLGIPTLLLARASDPLSRHVEGMVAEYAASYETFADPERLRDVVDAWMRRERRRIDDGPRRRRTRAVRLVRLRDGLEREWRRLPPDGRREVMAITGMPATRIERMLERPEHLDAASLHEIVALAGALGVDFERLSMGSALPDLDHAQRRALEAAADEYGWGGRETLVLERQARVELAKPAIRRIRLASMQDWLRFATIQRSR